MARLLPDFTFVFTPTPNSRDKAIRKLWEEACSEIKVRHPDPQARVDLRVVDDPMFLDPFIKFCMPNVHDTGAEDPRKMQRPDFGHAGWPKLWPGRRAAKIYLAALWGLYCAHEAFELVTRREVTFLGGKEVETVHYRSPIIDAHDSNGLNQQLLCSTGDLHKIIAWACGDKVASELLTTEAIARADKDVEAAMEDWQPGT